MKVTNNISEIYKNIVNVIRTQNAKVILFITIFLGSFLRLFYIGNIPGNNNIYADEALCGYEAWSLLTYGYDYKGYPFPVYLPSWGTGMNALQAYIQMPFIKLFGLNSFSVRLPAAILGCITLYAFYYICKKIKNEKFALLAVFILSVMPWHIMQSRWSMECNFFSGFITIAFALLIKASENNHFLPLAFFIIGLSLYAYALPWTIMPFLVLSITAYLLIKKQIHFDRYLLLSYLVLTILALPLLLFIMVNMGIIPEIVTPFISMPKLLHFRSDELLMSTKGIIKNFYHTLSCFITQDDGYKQSITPMFGLYYKFSNFIILIGISHCFISFWNSRKDRICYEFMFMMLFILSIFVGSTVEISFYRMNMIHMPMTYFLLDGLWFIAETVQKQSIKIIVFIYGASCICFMSYYMTYQDEVIADIYNDGTISAIDYIHELKDSGQLSPSSKVHVISDISFTNVLFIENYPTDKYLNEVVYEELEITGLRELAKTFGYYDFVYRFSSDYIINPQDIYMCRSDEYDKLAYLESNGMELNWFSKIVIAKSPD